MFDFKHVLCNPIVVFGARGVGSDPLSRSSVLTDLARLMATRGRGRGRAGGRGRGGSSSSAHQELDVAPSIAEHADGSAQPKRRAAKKDVTAADPPHPMGGAAAADWTPCLTPTPHSTCSRKTCLTHWRSKASRYQTAGRCAWTFLRRRTEFIRPMTSTRQLRPRVRCTARISHMDSRARTNS